MGAFERLDEGVYFGVAHGEPAYHSAGVAVGDEGEGAVKGPVVFLTAPERHAVDPNLGEMLGRFGPILEVGGVVPLQELGFFKNPAFIHLVDILYDHRFVRAGGLHFLEAALNLLELESEGSDVGVGGVIPVEMERL